MLPEINLLPKYQRKNSLGYVLFLIGLITALLLLILLALYYFYLRGSAEEVSGQLIELRAEQETLQAELANVEVRDGEDQFMTAYNYVNRLIIPTSYLVDDLIIRLPGNSYLSRYDYTDEIVEIEVDFETMSATAEYVEQLQKSNYVTDVKVDELVAFEQQTDEEYTVDAYYETIPRYTVIYTLEVNPENLQQAGEADE